MTQEKALQLQGFIDQYQVQLEGCEAELNHLPFGLPGSLYAQRRETVEGRAERYRDWIAFHKARLTG